MNAIIMDNVSKEYVNVIQVIKDSFVINVMLLMENLTNMMIQLFVILDGMEIVVKKNYVKIVVVVMENVIKDYVIVLMDI
jgi:hypothetical protein